MQEHAQNEVELGVLRSECVFVAVVRFRDF